MNAPTTESATPARVSYCRNLLAFAADSLTEAARVMDEEASEDLPDPVGEACDITRRAAGVIHRDRQIALSAICNSARIAIEYKDGSAAARAILAEEITEAAIALAMIENVDGFEWEQMPNDWETVCALIANALESGRSLGWKEIAELINAPSRGGAA